MIDLSGYIDESSVEYNIRTHFGDIRRVNVNRLYSEMNVWKESRLPVQVTGRCICVEIQKEKDVLKWVSCFLKAKKRLFSFIENERILGLNVQIYEVL